LQHHWLAKIKIDSTKKFTHSAQKYVGRDREAAVRFAFLEPTKNSQRIRRGECHCFGGDKP